jgi:hypothetical protein
MTITPTKRPDPQPFFLQAAAGVAQTGQPGASLAALDTAMAGAIGHKLFTVLVLNWAREENQRYYSNQPDAYPVGGSKPIVRDSASMRQVVIAGQCRINHKYADIAAAFFDHELIRSLGCESSVNVPVRWNGTTIGMLNLLHESGYYTEADIPTLSVFAGLAVPALLDIIKDWQA